MNIRYSPEVEKQLLPKKQYAQLVWNSYEEQVKEEQRRLILESNVFNLLFL